MNLLLIDISARLPYGVVLDIDTSDWRAPQGHIKLKVDGVGIIFKNMSLVVNGNYYGEKYKPYLRPMEDMTEEEREEYRNIDSRSYSCPIEYAHIPASDRIDWLNRKMFDYRGLIPKGLALPAPKEMYK